MDRMVKGRSGKMVTPRNVVREAERGADALPFPSLLITYNTDQIVVFHITKG